ncbi:ABC transporter permease [Paenibacillus dakarensis]|uniref:ABC transporter permease n=1 Tax=Paenibacillus dakarensis TaxID=1527293 RepID=UPI0006D549F1|nr:ABC transporter permease [Paenibacillus dakarensis]
MASYIRAISSEWLKISGPGVWIQLILSPVLALLVGMFNRDPGELNPWHIIVGSMAGVHALLFLPILTGVLSAMVCRYEHMGGGWKQLLVAPVSRIAVYCAKFSVVILLLAAAQLLFLAAIFGAGWYHEVNQPMPWDMLMTSLLGGWVACMPLAALQLAVSTAWSSFAAPLALNIIFTVPNILIVNSVTFGPYYPWAQPLLAMIPSEQDAFGAFVVPLQTLMGVILGGLVIFFVIGLLYFQRKEV